MNWFTFIQDYEICEETAQVRSKARSHMYGTSRRNIPPYIKKVDKGGYVHIRHKAYKVRKLYFETFGKEFDGVI